MPIHATRGSRNERYRRLHQIALRNTTLTQTPDSIAEVAPAASYTFPLESAQPRLSRVHTDQKGAPRPPAASTESPVRLAVQACPRPASRSERSKTSTVRNTLFEEDEDKNSAYVVSFHRQRSPSPLSSEVQWHELRSNPRRPVQEAHWRDQPKREPRKEERMNMPSGASAVENALDSIRRAVRGIQVPPPSSDVHRLDDMMRYPGREYRATSPPPANGRDERGRWRDEPINLPLRRTERNTDSLVEENRRQRKELDAMQRELEHALLQIKNISFNTDESASVRERELRSLIRQKDMALDDAQQALLVAKRTGSISSGAEIEQLRRDLQEQHRLLADEVEKRKAAEIRENAATKHQSAMGKEVSQLQSKLGEVEKKADEEERRRKMLEQRAVSAEAQLRQGNPMQAKEIMGLRQRADMLSRESAGADTKVRGLLNEKAKLEDKIKIIRLENDGLHNRITELIEQRQTETKLIRDKDELKKRLGAAEEEIGRLKADRHDLKQDLADARSRNVMKQDPRSPQDPKKDLPSAGAQTPSSPRSQMPDPLEPDRRPKPGPHEPHPIQLAHQSKLSHYPVMPLHSPPPSYTGSETSTFILNTGISADLASLSSSDNPTLHSLRAHSRSTAGRDPYAGLEEAFHAAARPAASNISSRSDQVGRAQHPQFDHLLAQAAASV